MATIIVGTTPTITYKFSVISPNELVQAALTVKRGNKVVLTKTLSQAAIGENSISWKLSQNDTLSIGEGVRSVMLNWLIADGTRGTSAEEQIYFGRNHIKEVMS